MEEDALRILRAVRFANIFRFKLDNELKLAIIKNKHLLKNQQLTNKKKKKKLKRSLKIIKLNEKLKKIENRSKNNNAKNKKKL